MTKTPLADGPLRVGKRTVMLTHMDKPFWPKDGLLKRDLIAYYREIAPVMIPHLKGRPQALNRHPDGADGPNFFQKNVSGMHRPPWIDTKAVKSASTGETVKYLVCDEAATLLYVANLGCIEINPWLSRLGTLDRPDYAVIDLDPEDAPFPLVIEAATAVRRLLEDADIPSFPKTSGGRGLHVYIPLGAKYDYGQSRGFAQIVSMLAARALGDNSSMERSPKKRKGKVYFDVPQNRKGANTAAPYSVRPRPGATVSTPLAWKEVRKGLDPTAFTMKSVPKRVDKVGDLFRPVLGKGIDMAKAIERLQRA